MKKLQYKVWNKICEETIELEKQMGILKDLKRKKKRIDNSDSECDEDLEKEKLNNKKTNKKVKNIIKNIMVENNKDNVFRLGNSDKSSWGNKIVSSLVIALNFNVFY
ncbi:hypothetical protein RhiirA5_416479 [Rhizophagus irregularis]|uniref:Uncharacterized protein n=1 Tax=Rhizophagus irregularis TaxID=588596 RepID=A0A2I1ES89_9GLOM|nr:hypothetical protein RhiirA5_416479 [Rhizophagus irregularis]PKY24935.1 hypothetical protein RhiirB3_439680 [Rhizophagus irregularis]CAB5216332.1 unnamed protein product [Rhizophagus irregularis]CAB5309548.1 unnamed protein product [Rhizophagus irregularis]